MDLRLQRRVVVVTGGSSGVGLSTVRRLLDEGALVATCARDGRRLREATADFDGQRLLTGGCDVIHPEQVAGFAAEVLARFGAVDGLVLNAGEARMSTLATTSEQDWTDELTLKFASVLRPLHAFLPALRSSSQAAVVVVNAVLARQPERHMVATSAARAGVLNLSRSLSVELGPQVRVNSLLLGLVDTGQWRRRYESEQPGMDYATWSAQVAADRGVALGRFGTAEEVADLAAVLISPVSSYVTGAAVEVSGGVGRFV